MDTFTRKELRSKKHGKKKMMGEKEYGHWKKR